MNFRSLMRKFRPAAVRRKRPLPVDAELTRWCADQAGRLALHRLGKSVQVSWNTRMKTTAGRAFWPHRIIELNPKLKEFPPEETWNTLKHELAHLIAFERNLRRKIAPHGPEWRQACADLGIAGETVWHELPFPRQERRRNHNYQCPHCLGMYPRVKPYRRAVACYDCCRRFSQCRYDDRFRLVKVRPQVAADS